MMTAIVPYLPYVSIACAMELAERAREYARKADEYAAQATHLHQKLKSVY
jgi:hypothetical protein